MSSLLVEIHLTPDQLRVAMSALSITIINNYEDPSMYMVVDESIQVYKFLRKIADNKWPGWTYPNEALQKILAA